MRPHALLSSARCGVGPKPPPGYRVQKTLEDVKGSYFPASKSWKLRNNADEVVQQSGPHHRRRAAGGSFVVFQGQPESFKKRQANQLKQITDLRRTCTLDEGEIAKLREKFVSQSSNTNPNVTFKTFLRCACSSSGRSSRSIVQLPRTDGAAPAQRDEGSRGGKGPRRVRVLPAVRPPSLAWPHTPWPRIPCPGWRAKPLRGKSTPT